MNNTSELRHQLSQARAELKNLREHLFKTKAEFRRQVEGIQEQLRHLRDDAGAAVRNKETVVKSGHLVNERETNAASSTSASLCFDDLYRWKPIGRIRSMFEHKNGTPRQGGVCREGGASLSINRDIFTNPSHSLAGLEQFSHVWILFLFHRNNNACRGAKVRPPRLNGSKVGVFATRCPYRPNPVGLTLAKIERIEGDVLYFRGVDLLDGTPVIDIKPYIPQYDSIISAMPLSHCNPQNRPDDDAILAAYDKSLDDVIMDDAVYRSNDVTVEEIINKSDDLTNDNAINRSIDVKDAVDGCDDFRDLTSSDDVSLQGNTERHTDRRISEVVKNRLHNTSNAINGYEGVMKGDEMGRLESSDERVLKGCTEVLKGCTVYGKSFDSVEAVSGAKLHSQSNKAEPALTNVTSDRWNTCVELENSAVVADWIRNPALAGLTILFTPRSETQLQRFERGSTDPSFRLVHLADWMELRRAIGAILAADPRSIYRRRNCADRLYYFAVDGVKVTCWFDDSAGVAEVLGVHPANGETDCSID